MRSCVRLILVEDSANDAETLLRRLARDGFDVRYVSTEQELAAALAGDGGVIICDRRLGDPERLKEVECLARSGKPLQAPLSDRVGLAKDRRLREEAATLDWSDLLATIGHDMRSPLGVMLGYSELMRAPDLTVEERLEFLDTIARKGQELARVIDDILELSRLEAGLLEVRRGDVDLGPLIEDVMRTLLSQSKTNELQFRIHWDGREAGQIISDGARIRQVLMHVVGSAVKFTERKTVEVGIGIIERTAQTALVRVTVACDAGPSLVGGEPDGAADDHLRFGRKATKTHKGATIGLALAGRLARELGGEVFLEADASQNGRGYVATFDAGRTAAEIFSADLRPANGKVRPPLTRDGFENLSGISVLLVDDAADNRKLVQFLLQKQGANVDLAENGAAGVEKAIKGAHDIVLMDIQMPILDGLGATMRLRELGYSNPIVALSAHAMLDEQERCLAAGCDAYLPKPIDLKSLFSTVHRYANRLDLAHAQPPADRSETL